MNILSHYVTGYVVPSIVCFNLPKWIQGERSLRAFSVGSLDLMPYFRSLFKQNWLSTFRPAFVPGVAHLTGSTERSTSKNLSAAFQSTGCLWISYKNMNTLNTEQNIDIKYFTLNNFKLINSKQYKMTTYCLIKRCMSSPESHWCRKQSKLSFIHHSKYIYKHKHNNNKTVLEDLSQVDTPSVINYSLIFYSVFLF